MRQRCGVRGAIHFCVGLVLVGGIARQGVAFDLNGPWRLGLYVTRSALTLDDVCALDITQTGSILTAVGSCRGAAGAVTLQGTIDPDSGALSGSGSIGACGAIAFTGHAVSSPAQFTGTFDCSSAGVSGGINASRCGNGQIDPGESCDDGERDGGCCTHDCILRGAGTACADDGSPCTSDQCNATGDCVHTPLTGTCNDGNSCTSGDTCVNGLCVGNPLPDDTPCSDGNPCTSGDRCLANTCVATPVTCPACRQCNVTLGCIPMLSNGCKQSASSSLTLKHGSTDTVAWKWKGGDATSTSDLGSPTSTTDYDVCVFDGTVDANGLSPLLFGARAPAGDDWSATDRGVRYNRPDRAPGGVRRILADSGADQRARAGAKARGPNFTLPPLSSLSLPLSVQLSARDTWSSQCWEVRYNDAQVRTGRRINARVSVDTSVARPNILLIDLDDTRSDGIDRMPNLAALAAQGVSFSNSFVINPLCAPSRATMLTGLDSSHTGVRTLSGPLGGAHTMRERGSDRQTMGTWLQAAGYRTGLFGKYVNGYGSGAFETTGGPGGTYYVPPGWTRWRAMASPEHYGGIDGGTYSLIDERGIRTEYSDHTTDHEYSTDLLAAELRAFIADSVGEGHPFFAVWTPYASHAETQTLLPDPAARHFHYFVDLPAWRPPSWAEADMSDKPGFMQSFPIDPLSIAFTDLIRVGAYESLLAVDEQLRLIQDRLVELGIDENTVIIVTSDNGVSWGEHRRYVQAKECMYEECLRVPVIIYDPRATAPATVQAATALNIDLAPTVADFAGVEPPVALDGVSLKPWVTGPPPAQWRGDFLAMDWREARDETLQYSGQVSDGDQVRLSYGDSRVEPRPSLLFEFDTDDSVGPDAVRVAIGANADATFANLAAAVSGQVPFTSATALPTFKRVVFRDNLPQSGGVFLAVERDQAGVMQRKFVGLDTFSVRDVSNGFTYVRYESGELELYDLTLDPAQLDNKAHDPGYAATRARLADRLSELLH